MGLIKQRVSKAHESSLVLAVVCNRAQRTNVARVEGQAFYLILIRNRPATGQHGSFDYGAKVREISQDDGDEDDEDDRDGDDDDDDGDDDDDDDGGDDDGSDDMVITMV
ncbi:hypothetical protein AK812_SmicGene27175 [Symbiodinium microadriaticum]|uniref:Uncharacterized protein n=1 Tax=Symbiodinium microadriaticum TaxID=2951 RepID=A0A1Q9D7P0_SYMMI|nr:hypothetical protein AK812_SmicGene27175 [Symbiodinium microadriaticum]